MISSKRAFQFLTCIHLTLAVLVAALAPLVWASEHSADQKELSRSVPERDGTSAPLTGMQKEILQRARQLPAIAHKSLADRDYRHIALLEDTGTLLTFVETGLFRTNTEAIIQRFYASHADDFDGLVIFSAGDFAGDVQPEGGFAFELNVANDIDGIGFPKFNVGQTFAPGLQRLRTVINMNDLGEFDENPDALMTKFLNGASGMGILAQEFLHMVGAFVSADNIEILGRGGVHWSFFFHSQGSALEGNNWRDNGDGTFTTLQPATGFSQLDQYLLGMIRDDQVTEPMFAIESPQPNLLSGAGNATLPVPGVTVSGSRVDVSMANIQSLSGNRVPSADIAPKEFRLAFVLIVPPGHTPSAYDMEKIDEFRTQWTTFFARETNGIGSIETELGDEPVIADFESQVFAGAPGLRVEFDNDSFGSIRDLQWDFGDGATSDQRHPTHTYQTTGTYSVTLDVVGAIDSQRRLRQHYVRVGPTHTWFQDTFETDQGWTADPLDNAVSGRFVRSFPIGSWLRAQVGNDNIEAAVQPDHDHTPNGNQCYVTGLAGPGAAIGVADVDAGGTSIISPSIDLSQAEDPVLEWWSWYVNNAGASPGRDVFSVDVSDDDGQTWVRARTYRDTYDYWRQSQVRLLDFITMSDHVRVRFQVSDNSFASVVEGAVDDVHIFDVDTQTPVQVSNFRAAAHGNRVDLQWQLQQHGGDTVLGIELLRAASVEGPFEVLARLSGTAQSYTDDSATQSNRSWYRLILLSTSGRLTGPTITAARQATHRSRLQSAAEQDDGSVLLRYELARDGIVRFTLYDVRGRVVARHDLGHQSAGSYAQAWDRRDLRGSAAARGIYLLQLQTTDTVATRKLVLRR